MAYVSELWSGLRGGRRWKRQWFVALMILKRSYMAESLTVCISYIRFAKPQRNDIIKNASDLCFRPTLIMCISYCIRADVGLRWECQSTTIQTVSYCQLLVVLLFVDNDTTVAMSTEILKPTTVPGSVAVTSAKTAGMISEAALPFIAVSYTHLTLPTILRV